MHFTQTATINGEILCKASHMPPVDGAVPADDSISWDHTAFHPEVTTSVFNKGIKGVTV